MKIAKIILRLSLIIYKGMIDFQLNYPVCKNCYILMNQVQKSKIQRTVSQLYDYYSEEQSQHKEHIFKVVFKSTNYFTSYVIWLGKVYDEQYSLIIFNDETNEAKIGLAKESKGFPFIPEREPIFQVLFSVHQISRIVHLTVRQCTLTFEAQSVKRQVKIHFHSESVKQKWISILTILRHFKRCKFNIEHILDEEAGFACQQLHPAIKKLKEANEELEELCRSQKHVTTQILRELQIQKQKSRAYEKKLIQLQYSGSTILFQEKNKLHEETRYNLVYEENKVLQVSLKLNETKIEKLAAQNKKLENQVKLYQLALRNKKSNESQSKFLKKQQSTAEYQEDLAQHNSRFK